MVEIDWKKFMGIVPETLSEKEKDDIYETVAWYNPDNNLSRRYLIHFIRVVQEVLKYKFEQLESLTNELDEVAIKQGKEEGSKLQQYTDEIERLYEELDYYKKVNKTNGRSNNVSEDDFQQELKNLQFKNEELVAELNEREKDLMLEKKEVERYAGQVVILEREKQELSRELKALQEDGAEKSGRSLKDSPESAGAEKQETLTEIIRQKNKHISHLLEDIEILEEENVTLRGKISAVKDELSETTTHISEITVELSKLKHINEEYESNEADLKVKINGLTCQIEELVEEKTKHDKQLDEYVLMFNKKVQEWKEVMEAKDDEIDKLNKEIKTLYSSTNQLPNVDLSYAKLNKKISQQQEQINVLQQELQKATDEINNSTDLIEKLKEKQIFFNLPSDPHQTTSTTTTNFLEEKIKVLEEKLSYAENDALTKAEEMSNLVIQLREYESGIFGLSDAMIKIKKLEKSILKKDLQAEKLIEICNNLEIKLDTLEEQNFTLRERLGLSTSDEVDTSGIHIRLKKDEELMENLKYQLDRKEEELIQVKLKYRQVVTNLNVIPQSGGDGGGDANNIVHIEHYKPETRGNQQDEELMNKLKYIIRENDALRKGMHEILESIREQDSSGKVEVQSTCLERLLAALDSRHVSGWYHPAMRLQVQLSAEEGKNDELRNQIRSMRVEEKKKASELQNAYLKIQSLENDLSTPREKEKEIESEENSNASAHSKTKPQNTEINVLQEQKILDLESELYRLKVEADCNTTNFKERERSFIVETEKHLSEIEELQCRIKVLKRENNSEVEELAELKSQIVVLTRKVKFLENLESDSRECQEKLRQELLDKEGKMLEDIVRLHKTKLELLNKIKFLEERLLRMVSMEEFTSVVNELESLRNKYKCAICLSLMKEETDNAENLRLEIQLLQKEKESLFAELQTLRQKLIVAEALIREEAVTKGDFSNEISTFASNLAASEVRELNERQKASHLEKVNDALKLQHEEMENRIKELLEKVEELTKDNFRYQETERVLRTEIVGHLTREDREFLEGKVEKLEEKLNEVAMERDNVQELFEISQGQFRALQEWKNSDQILLSSQAEQILLLQASGDDKANISRLSHELTMSKLLSSELAKKNNDLKIKITKLLGQNMTLETKISEYCYQMFKMKRKYLTHTGHLLHTINDVRKLYGCAATFGKVEKIYNAKMEANEKKKNLIDEVRSLNAQRQEYLLKKEEMETQLESLEDLKAALKGETKNLISWHNKTTELRIKEAKQRRQNEFLTAEVSQLQNCVEKLNEELTALEQCNMEKEKEWEQKQLLWEESQLEACTFLQEKGVRKAVKPTCDVATNTLDVSSVEDRRKSKEGPLVSEIEKPKPAIVVVGPAGDEGDKVEDEDEDEEVMETSNDAEQQFKIKHEEKTLSNLDRIDNAEKEALKMTVESLEHVVRQKEETILRYQDLLKEGRDEYGKSYSKLQEELKNLNESIAVQSRAYNKLKYATKANSHVGDSISVVVEKYLTKIQELEEELRECQLNLSSVNTQSYINQQEVEKWRNLAMERLLQMDDNKRRLEEEYRSDMENCRREIKKYQTEVEKLTKMLEFHRTASDTGNPIEENENSKMNVVEPEDSIPEYALNKQQSQKFEQGIREVEALKRQLKFAKDESARLREQVRVLQARPQRKSTTKISGSLTTRSDSKSSVREGSLTSKIKTLEDMLTTSKEREKELLEISQKKLKSAEEVARWDERKKNQQLIKNLTTKLKEREAEVEVLTNKNECFRNMVYKCERDKTILETQLKAVKGSAGGVNSRIEKLLIEKKQLETDLSILQDKLEEQQRHSCGIGAALLHEKLEAQERKLVAFELSSKGNSALMDDLDKLRTINGSLEKTNLKLESENLSLQLKLEKEKADAKYLADKIKQLQQEVKNCDEEKGNSHLRTIEKLREENKRLQRLQKTSRSFGEVDKLRKDLTQLRDDNKLLRQKYADLMDKNIALEEEVQSLRYQIHLMEEKDFTEVFKNPRNVDLTSELSHEISELKAKLAHKNQLLGRVKVLLIKAAAKEKALHKEVAFLQDSKSSSDV